MENNNNNSNETFDMMSEAALKTYEYNFFYGLSALKGLLGEKALGQKAFTRSIIAGFENGIAPEDYKPNFQSEDEEKVAGLIDQLIDLKLAIKMNRLNKQTSQGETNKGENNNG